MDDSDLQDSIEKSKAVFCKVESLVKKDDYTLLQESLLQIEGVFTNSPPTQPRLVCVCVCVCVY